MDIFALRIARFSLHVLVNSIFERIGPFFRDYSTRPCGFVHSKESFIVNDRAAVCAKSAENHKNALNGHSQKKLKPVGSYVASVSNRYLMR